MSDPREDPTSHDSGRTQVKGVDMTLLYYNIYFLFKIFKFKFTIHIMCRYVNRFD